MEMDAGSMLLTVGKMFLVETAVAFVALFVVFFILHLLFVRGIDFVDRFPRAAKGAFWAALMVAAVRTLIRLFT